MKKTPKFIGILISLIMLFSVVSPMNITVQAMDNSDVTSITNHDYQKDWINKNSYPILPEDNDWSKLSYTEQLKACNAPDDFIGKCSTGELANLVLEYPFLIDVLAFNNAEQGIEHLKKTSNICEKFFSRVDSKNILLEKYGNLSVNYDMLNDCYTNKSKDKLRDSGYIKEIFLQSYFATKVSTLDRDEKLKLKKIIGEKYDMKKGKCDDYTTGLLIYDEIQSMYGDVSRDLIPDNIYNDLVNKKNQPDDLSTLTTIYGFTPSGEMGTMNEGATYKIGTFTIFGVTAGCYQYYSGDYKDIEKNELNASFDTTHSSWTRNSTCTKKYNCHSFAWIDYTTSNIYWLNNPDFYSNSSSFSRIGIDCGANQGDRIIIEGSIAQSDGFGNDTYSLHSLRATSTGSSWNFTTKSKLGCMGVYTAPISDMFTFYSGFCYGVYR